MQIPDVPQPPVKIPPQLVTLELDPLEPTDALDQLMSFVFEPPDQELQLLHTVPSIFDGDLISFLDEFEREMAPIDLTMPRLDPCNGFGKTLARPVSTSHHYRIWKSGSVAGSSHALRVRVSSHHLFEPNFGVHVPRSLGKTVIVFTSHLDLTWNNGVDIKFFRVGRFPSRQVWEAYQPQNMEAYPLDLTHSTRLIKHHPTRLFCSCQRHQGKPVPIELSIATILSDCIDPQVITVNHGGQAPRNVIHEHERLRLVHTPLPKPVEYLSFCVRGKLSQMGRGGLMVVKGAEPQKIS
ncbi:hypothetical protein TNCV_2368451 [Trichonephila clavipes]|nr:hypothetical protein TNCV_2368451 [Trichonephila clavipes]